MTVAHEEDIAGGALNFPGEQKRMAVPHVLKDGADSVGLIGALSRVYVSIGEYSQEWLRDHNALVGGNAATAVRDCQGAEELRLLASHSGTHAEPGEVSDEDARAEAGGCARRKGLPHA